MRVLYLNHRGDRAGGGEESLLDLIAALPKSVRPLAVTGESGAFADRLRAAGCPPLVLPLPDFRSLRWLTRRGTLKRLAALCREEAVRVVHANTGRAALYAVPLARRAGLPLVIHLRAGQAFSAGLRRALRRADRVIAISRHLAGVAAEQGVEPERIRVVPNGVDLDRFAAVTAAAGRAARGELGAKDGDFLAGLVARLDPVKDHPTFLRAAARLAGAGGEVGWRFAVVGGRVLHADRDYPARLEALARDLGLGGRLVFAGARADIPAVNAALDAAVLPSRAEGLGRTLIEAMAAGKPAVAAAAGGMPEVVADGETGLLFPPGDDEALAGALARLAGDRDLAARLGAAGRERARALFSREKMAAGVLAVYEEL